MCDHDSMDVMQKAGELSRRQFGALGVGAAAVIAMLPRAANAVEVSESEVVIKTPDGNCDAHFVHPTTGAHAAVLVWPDIFGLRPGFRTMGKRLAESGYAVLTVNPFYRIQKAPTAESTDMSAPGVRDKLFAQMNSLTPQTHATDATAFVTWLDAQKQVDKKKKIGTEGYCMGGPIVFRTAAARADRIGAGATFHGGGLTTKNADSPHLLIPKMKASLLICIAENDDKTDPTSKDILKQSFADAKVSAKVDVYPAQHGWCSIDSAVYNKEQAEKAYALKLELYKKALA